MPSDEELYANLKRYSELQANYKLFFYTPYAKQRAFHDLGAIIRERMFMAGNQLGKTYAAGFETAFHLTGIYPDWWQGKRFDRPTAGWVASVTSELTRDGAQRILMGRIGQWGTGCIPKENIIDIKRARGVPDAIETVTVRHASGGVSQVTFKAYSDGREAFQAETLDFIWEDEEPPLEVHTECVTRTNNTGGIVYLTFTPLMGMSNLVMRFLNEKHPDRQVVNMTIHDAEHYTPAQRQQIIDSYPEHERDARSKGIPMLGSGRIYPVADEVIAENPLVVIPAHWKQIIGMDFGWDHPTAAAHLVLDPDADCLHVTKTYRKAKEMPLVHTAAIKPWGTWVPVAWPLDALQHDKGGSCEQLSKQYHDHGLNMLSTYAQFPDKRGRGVDAGIIEILERMRTGRFKVDKNLSEWFEEFRLYHRKDGQIVKLADDLMDGTRYGTMMLRYALPQAWAPQPRDKYARGGSGTGSWMSA